MGLDAIDDAAPAAVGETVDWLRARGFLASSFLTLTFDEAKLGHISPERAIKSWRRLLDYLMLQAWGHRYQRKWKRSSVSYVAAVDYSKLGAVHLHVVVDGWLDWRTLHDFWSRHFGFAWVKPVGTDEDDRMALMHVVKYATKGDGLVELWISTNPNRRG